MFAFVRLGAQAPQLLSWALQRGLPSVVMGQGSCLRGGDVVTTCGLCKPPTSPAFLSTTLFNWSPAPSISEHLACLWPLCLSPIQPLLQAQIVALSDLLYPLQCVYSFPSFQSLVRSSCLLVSSVVFSLLL